MQKQRSRRVRTNEKAAGKLLAFADRRRLSLLKHTVKANGIGSNIAAFTIESNVVQFHSSSFRQGAAVLKNQEAWDWSQKIREESLHSIIRIPKALTKVISPAVWK